MSDPAVSAQVIVDADVNAATLVFIDLARGSGIIDYPIRAANGDLIAVVTFTTQGRLAQIQLLDAERQLAGL